MFFSKKVVTTILLINAILLAFYFYKFNPYTTDLIIYPTSSFDSLKMSGIVNSKLFQQKFAADKNISPSSAFKAKTSRDGLITISFFADSPDEAKQLSGLLKNYLISYFETNELYGSNKETLIFICNDMIAAAQGELQKIPDADPDYLLKYSIEGFYLKHLMRIQATAAVDARLNNADLIKLYSELASIKHYLLYMITYNKYVIPAYDIAKLNAALDSSFHLYTIEIAKSRIAWLEQKLSAKMKILEYETADRKFSTLNLLGVFLFSSVLLVALLFFLELLSSKGSGKHDQR